jgi:hypothetical protein
MDELMDHHLIPHKLLIHSSARKAVSHQNLEMNSWCTTSSRMAWFPKPNTLLRNGLMMHHLIWIVWFLKLHHIKGWTHGAPSYLNGLIPQTKHHIKGWTHGAPSYLNGLIPQTKHHINSGRAHRFWKPRPLSRHVYISLASGPKYNLRGM